MANIYFELDSLKYILENRGIEPDAVTMILQKASADIDRAMASHTEAAMQLAIEDGVQKRSAEFINELKLNQISMQLTTDSGNMDFSEPPFPMLPRLLQGAKPIKDGSGVYKVIPVGESSRNRPRVSSNIYDAWKQVNAERMEASRAQRERVTPKNSKAKFRTATSKQNANTQWVQPAKDKDFTDTVQSINKELSSSLEDIVRNIIRDYEENF
jgi:hypothetical protein